MTRVEQFKKLAQMLTDIEMATIQLHKMTGEGFAISKVDTYLQQEGLTVMGASAMVAMIKASDLIQFNANKTALIPKPHVHQDDGLIEVE